MKLAIGRLGFFNPTRARRIARLMAFTASSWPIILLCKVSSIFRRRTDSSAETLSTGIPVHEATICCMSTSVTTGPSSPASLSALLISLPFSTSVEICALRSISLSLSSPAYSKI
ncbi:hypothetical protein Lalb_Chr12g0202431 [Lupinus albus]|uniref:Uncharacterized protein n=1 Tax=Lupinus albus TaxID=3870 RepID=A0A6A4PME5_LUPAL|nr:hypothetical protein Lalb_Chr12g0202431 [Lupinus albus]